MSSSNVDRFTSNQTPKWSSAHCAHIVEYIIHQRKCFVLVITRNLKSWSAACHSGHLAVYLLNSWPLLSVRMCVCTVYRPTGKLCSSSYRAKCSTTFTSICDDADCKLFTESHLANNFMPFYCRHNDALCFYWSHRPIVTNFPRLAVLAVIFSAA